MKKLLFSAILLLVMIQSKAQIKLHVGVSTALNSTFVLDKGLKADPRYLSTGTYKWAPIGVSFGVDFTRNFGLQIESIKAAQGQYYQVMDAYNEIVGERNFDMTYLQIPLMLKLMSGGNGLARFNFQIGPQLSIIQTGTELLKYAESVQNIPVSDEVPPPDGAVLLPDGNYQVPAYDQIVTGTPDVTEALYNFQEKEIQLAAAVGADVDIARNFYLSLLIRANYSFTDMRGDDLLALLATGTVSEIFDQRANLAVGFQFGFHWMIGGTRRANSLDKQLRDEMRTN